MKFFFVVSCILVLSVYSIPVVLNPFSMADRAVMIDTLVKIPTIKNTTSQFLGLKNQWRWLTNSGRVLNVSDEIQKNSWWQGINFYLLTSAWISAQKVWIIISSF
jgi:hypothetical protein